jgi:hypothetical protein
MYIYDKLFSEYHHTVAQLLITGEDIANGKRHENFNNTLNRLLELGALPIINENDTVATEEIVIGDNDTLAAIVAQSVNAQKLVLLSDIDGLYTADPHSDPNAKLIFPIVIPEGYRWYMLLSLAVTLLFFTALFLFFRVVTRNCYLPVGLGLFVFLFFKERSQDIQTAALGPERALFDPFISCYFLGNSVPASLSLPHLWTLNRLLFLDLGLLLLVVSCLLLRREKLHEGFGE